jgi:hemolysin D
MTGTTDSRNEPRRKLDIRRRRPTLLSADDAEFLPPAEGVTRAQPSPVRLSLILAICLFFAAVLAVSWIGKIDIYAVAPGRIQPLGRSKVVQPVDAGKVIAVHVADGAHVNAGEPLIDLDASQALAEFDSTARHKAALRAEIARRQAGIAYVLRGDLTGRPTASFPADLDRGLVAREQEVLDSNVSDLVANINIFTAKIAEEASKQKALEATIAARTDTINTLRARVRMRQGLELQGWETRANVLDAAQDLNREVASQRDDEGHVLESRAAAITLQTQIVEAKQKFQADYSDALEMAEEMYDMVSEDLLKAKAALDHSRITAPIDGTIQELAVTTIGQVVNAGQQLMTLVPNSGSLEIEALIENKDIGFVQIGQMAVIKIDTFPFTRYGTVSGRVIKVSRDAVDQDEAQAASSTQSKPIQPTASAASPTPATKNLVYPVTIAIDRNSMVIDGAVTPLAPGMTTSVEIKTGRRTVVEYLLSPLEQTVSEALHER